MTNPTPDQPTGMNKLREILARNKAYYFEITHEGMSIQKHYFENYMSDDEAEAAVQQLVERCLGQDEYIPPTKPITKFSKPSSVDYRNSVRADIRHNLQQAGLLRGEEA